MTPPLDQSLSALAREAIELAGKAKAGEWRVRRPESNFEKGKLFIYLRDDSLPAGRGALVATLARELRDSERDANAALCVHARNSIERIARGYLEAVERVADLELMLRATAIPNGLRRLGGPFLDGDYRAEFAWRFGPAPRIGSEDATVGMRDDGTGLPSLTPAARAALSSLAGRVRAIEERIGGKDGA